METQTLAGTASQLCHWGWELPPTDPPTSSKPASFDQRNSCGWIPIERLCTLGTGGNYTILTVSVFLSESQTVWCYTANQVFPVSSFPSSPWPRRHSCLHHPGNVLLGLATSLAWVMSGHHCIHSSSYWASQTSDRSSTPHPRFWLVTHCFSVAKLCRADLPVFGCSHTNGSSLECHRLQVGMKNHWAGGKACQNPCLDGSLDERGDEKFQESISN